MYNYPELASLKYIAGAFIKAIFPTVSLAWGKEYDYTSWVLSLHNIPSYF